ncbi:MAG: N-acetylmuramoyl-L-alanine amidase [Chryseobacterium sp. SCN 40-13]|nr:MAG: N-acetylmuramoyl-L-alanine amidase [Chryseobacterium sp. SCN 40-13]
MKIDKILCIIGLCCLMISCSAQRIEPQPTAGPPKTNAEPSRTAPKPAITQSHGVEFYRQNIGDITKNDNTISHGSIVSAKPQGYVISKSFFPAVAQNFRQRYLILHYTALDEEKSVRVLTQQAVSSHYLVNNLGDREIYQLVDENKRAYHAGVSAWRNDKNLNDTSIGIEIVNTGYILDSVGKKVFSPYDESQIKKVAALVKDIVERYQIPPVNILAHSDIAPTRKQDPGPMFPWKKLYDEYNIGMWYDEEMKQKFMNETTNESFAFEQNSIPFITKVQNGLKKFGYDIVPTGVWNRENIKVLEAFQYRFRPEIYDGVVDRETWAILQALNQKYP